MGMQKLASSVSKIRKSQNLLLYSLMAGMTIVILALTAALVAGSSTIRKPQPKSYKAPITSGSSRMDPKEVYVEKLTTDHEIQGKRLDAVEKMLETLIKINDGAGKVPQRIEQTMIMPGYPQHPQQSSPSLTGTDPKYQHISMTGHPVAEVRGDLQAVLGDEGNPSQDFITGSSNQSNPHAKGTGAPLKQEKTPRFRSKGIQRTSLMLANSKSNKNLKTADNTVPAGAFAGAVMVGGVDASTSIQASNDPRPVLLRVTDPGTLPRKFKSDLCGCHVLAACYGDISSERVYMRLEKLTCTERKTGEIVEMAVNGYVAGEDGRAGLRGIVVDRAGESMRNAAIGGFLSGMGNFLSQSHSPVTFSPANGLAQTNPMTNPDMLKFGAAKGASGALDKYAEFYIKRAEQMQPVIQVQAGRKVDIVFTQGVAFENSAARADMIRVNDQHRLSQIHNSSDTTSKPVEAWVPNQTPLSEHGIRTYGVRVYPQHWSLHAMGELIGDLERDQAQIPCPFMIHYGVTIPKQDKPKNKLLAKASYVEKQAFSPIGKYLPNIMAEAEELAFVREALNKGERIVQAQFGVILMSKPEEMDNAEQILLNLFTAKEWKLEANRYLHLPMFITSLPMMWGEGQVQALLHLQKLKTTLSTESANLLPIQGEWKGTSTPGMLLAGRRGQVFTWSPFDNNAGNYNVCVVGRSGSGKSVFMQELVTTTRAIGGRVFILDVGRSFQNLCDLLEGQLIEFSSTSDICFNPFSTIPTNNEEVASDALAMLKSVLVLMAAPKHGLDDPGAALLEQAMLETWSVYKNQSTISDIADWLIKRWEEKGDRRAEDLAQSLYSYTINGTYGRFFNGPSTINFDNALIVIELEELKERKDLQAVVVQMVIVNITNLMFLGDRKTPFNIVIDEAWDMLRDKQSGVFIETLARRLRKYRGSLVVGTQSVNDFYQSPGAQAAFDNSDTMCMLSQKEESIAQLKKADRLSMSAQKEQQLKSVKTKQGQFAEVMIITPLGYFIARVFLDTFSNLLFSTKAEDYAAINQQRQLGKQIGEAVDILSTPKQLLLAKQ